MDGAAKRGGWSVSIDGPTASGKTTLGLELARLFGATFLDTGLTYRAVAYAVASDNVTPDDSPLETIIEHRPAVFRRDGQGTGAEASDGRVLYRGHDVSEQLWAGALDAPLKGVASNPDWRSQIVLLHQQVISDQPAVVVGRDVAETLLPDATLRIFLTASLFVRRERRRAQYRDVHGRSTSVGPATERDQMSQQLIRSLPNSIDIDSTYLPAYAVLACVLRRLGERK